MIDILNYLDLEEGNKQKLMNLKDFLQKKLTVSQKEAQLIESVIKEYAQKKKSFKETGENSYSIKITNNSKKDPFFYKDKEYKVNEELVIPLDYVIETKGTTIGRKSYNDIVINNNTVSGEHAIIKYIPSETFNKSFEDLQKKMNKPIAGVISNKPMYQVIDNNSTNGTLLNRRDVDKNLLFSNPEIFELGFNSQVFLKLEIIK